MEELYQQHILDHYKNPRNKRVLSDFDIKKEGFNPSCGDSLILYIKFDENDVVSDVGFEGQGCAISQASMSMLTEKILGMNREELKLITSDSMYEMLGVKVSPARERCALLPLEALKNGI